MKALAKTVTVGFAPRDVPVVKTKVARVAVPDVPLIAAQIPTLLQGQIPLPAPWFGLLSNCHRSADRHPW
jgi:hypothetical protein